MLDLKPFPHQQDIIDNNSRARVVVAARRTGKSMLIRFDALNFNKSIILSFSSSAAKLCVDAFREIGFDWKRGTCGSVLRRGNKTIYVVTTLNYIRDIPMEILYIDESSWVSLDEDKYIKAFQNINPKTKLLVVGTPYPRRNARFKRLINMQNTAVFHIPATFAPGFTPEADRNLRAYMHPSTYASEILGLLL